MTEKMLTFTDRIYIFRYILQLSQLSQANDNHAMYLPHWIPKG